MTSQPDTHRKPIWLLIVFPPLLFIAKDIIATIIVLSYEPGITENAVRNYNLQLLPGSLFVPNNYAFTLNAGLGVELALSCISSHVTGGVSMSVFLDPVLNFVNDPLPVLTATLRNEFEGVISRNR